MTWTITDGTNTYTCFTNSVIRYNLEEMDSAEVRCRGYFTEDTAVRILEGSTVIFRGYVKNITQDSNERTYLITIIETANELKDTIVTDSGSRSFIKSSQTVQSLVDTILTGTGWTRGTADSTVITSLGFYQSNALTSLFKLLKDMQDNKIWFIDNGTTKVVYWGDTRTDRTATSVSYISKTMEVDSNDRNITKVTVLGQSDTYSYTAGTGTKERVFRYKLAKTSAECQDVATKLLADYGVARNRYKVKIHPNYTYEIGDLVKVDGTNYTIYDIETTPSYTTLGIGSYGITYADTLGSDLTTISGEVSAGTDASWSGGNTNVAANAAAATDYVWDIASKSMISDPYIDVTIGSFIKSADVSANTGILSDISMVTASADAADIASFVSEFYLPDSTGVLPDAITNGFQFGLCSFSVNLATESAATVYFTLQKNYNSGGWEYAGANSITTSNTSFHQISLSYLFSGSTNSESSGGARTYYRVRVFAGGTNMKSVDNYVSISRCPRHAHTVATTYDKSTTGTPPTTVNVSVNGNSLGAITPGTPVAISLAYLNDGKNTISVTTPSGSGNQCSVNPTITYKTLGVS